MTEGEEVAVRFEVTHVLDAIEAHLTTDVVLAQAVVDLGEIAWFDALDDGRRVNLLRTGVMLDAFSRHLGEDSVMVYVVAGRELLADQDLSSKERMVLGRWAGDGLIEVVPNVAGRAVEVADITGLPLLTRDGFPGLEGRYPWLRGQSDRVLRMVPADGGARILGGVPGPPKPDGPGLAILGRVWACARRECPAFGERRLQSQPAPRMRAGVPVCPRHDEPLRNLGPKAPAVPLAVLIDGVVRHRFAVQAGRPVVVGRSPDDPDGVRIGPWLSGEAAQMISRNHVRIELRDDVLMLSDMSTNGTIVRSRKSPYSPGDEVHLGAGPPYPLRPWDTVELHHGVILARADGNLIRSGQAPGSVMGDAPTISMRPPDVVH